VCGGLLRLLLSGLLGVLAVEWDFLVCGGLRCLLLSGFVGVWLDAAVAPSGLVCGGLLCLLSGTPWCAAVLDVEWTAWRAVGCCAMLLSGDVGVSWAAVLAVEWTSWCVAGCCACC
jgi:hypothetical protein